jgi:hypothetical protein
MAGVRETVMVVGFEAVTAAAMKSTIFWDVFAGVLRERTASGFRINE